MTIATIRITSSPMYELNSLCERNKIPYMHLQAQDASRHGIPKKYVETMLTPNKLVIVESLATLKLYFDSMCEQKVLWGVVVRGSELEATEHKLAYCQVAHRGWIADVLTDVSVAVTAYPEKKLQANKNNSYLSQVLTDLYRIKPKEERPFTEVFSYLAGKLKFPSNLPSYLVKSLTKAEAIRTAIKDLAGNYSIESVRAVAKKHSMDVFDINYTLAKTGLLPDRKEKK